MAPKSTAAVAGIAVAVLVVLQLIQPERTNPPADARSSMEAALQPPSPVATSLRRACGDCHSNQTRWPWYSRISPVSWLIAKDVREGRAHLNLSAWNRSGEEQEDAGELCAKIRAGSMPPRSYLWLHPGAKLSADEVAAICAFPFAQPGVARR